ncbi:cohesin subunit SA-2 isoform X3 [Girardinichthys multiradiatus]|uniref:cohesin subunit SA-2 isoform X3 n=1 Tax=Girardinichthys multiradiatus TaxID=208333 RepID=UPI001FACA86E|nr:cohesin subunit SA-2 isoform X3 [Girardinichthys multiradiatus]
MYKDVSAKMETGSSVSDSLEDLDLSSESVSICDAQTKGTKRSKQLVTGPQPPKRPRRNAALRVTSSPSSSPIPSPPDPSQQQQSPSQGVSRKISFRRMKSVTEESQGISAKDIYDAVCSGKSAMVTVVEEWLCSYKQSREAGLLVLINFIVQCCGCKGVVSRDMFESMENADIISKLTKEFNEDSVNYPLSTPGPQVKRFKAGLCEFIRVLVRSCRNSFVYDEFLFHTLLALLTGLSDSQVRAFRHTSTFLAMKLMTGLVDLAVAVSGQLQTTQRQCDTENSKGPHEQASDRLQELKASIREENREELSFMINATFRGVFVHRYRDRLPDIRVTCIEELGVWLKTDPENFLNDGCLKYLGWTLHDKQSPVRLQSVRALQGLYQEKEFIGRLELFTSRFKERILSMVLDKDPDVAVEVVNLLLMIQLSTEEGLKEEECGHMYPVVYTSHRGLASAAGAFLYNKLKCVITANNQEDDNSSNAAFLQILISFYIQSEFHEHGAYLVDSLWTVAGSELRDWDVMTALLLQDSGLMYEEEGALLEIMVCSIRQAAEATPPVGRIQSKKILSMKHKKIQEQDRTRITTHFIPILPQLLSKYSADAEKVVLLLRLPLYYDLDMYSSTQWLEKHFDLLLSQICSIVKKHTDAAVLQACARLASTLCSDCYTFSSRAHLAFGQLLDDLTECFNTYLSDLLEGTADEDGVYNAATALKRIAALSSAKDPTGWQLFDSCLELLKSRIESLDFDTELMVAALKCAAFHLMWAKVNAVNIKAAEADLKRLKKEVRLFCRICQTCLCLDQTKIRDQAFEVLCDLLLLYSAASVRGEPVLQTLVHLPSDSLRAELASFLLDFVFTDSENIELDDEGLENKVALLQKKRNQLGGYCKLVIYGVLDLSAATNVFKHYSKYFKDFGDIIKETVSKSKLINPIQSAKIVCLSLQQLFSEMLTEGHNQQDFTEMRELARRLAMSFGVDLHRARKQLVVLHLDGIRFAFHVGQEGEEEHPNLAFLEILSEFSFKLLPQDRAQLADFVKSKCPRAALSWPSVKLYQRSLESRSSKYKEPEQGGEAVSFLDTPVAKRKKTTAPDSASSTTRASLLGTSSIQSHLHTPALTSTALRQTTKQPAAKKPTATVSESGSGLTELESEDEFSSDSHMRKVKPTKQGKASSLQTATQQDLDSHLTLLSLIEDDISERAEGDSSEGREPEIEDYESDKDNDYTLPSTRHTSASILDELFD